MPHFDKRREQVVLRVVYDGAPEAGKTTNVRALHDAISLQRRGQLRSPGTAGRRTEFFDWLDFAGGYVEGHRIRCQLITVPGQASLLRRRSYLLDTADAVVFVADSRAGLIEENRRAFELMRAAVRKRQGAIPVGILLQANKQDLPSATTPEELAAKMEVGESVPTFAAKAIEGKGVVETFLMAVRLASDRVRALAAEGGIPEAPEEIASADALFSAMQALDEGTTDSVVLEPPPRTPSPIPEIPSVDAQTAESDGESESAPPEVVRGPESPLRPPAAEQIPAGGSWPPVIARSVWNRLDGLAIEPRPAHPWAPPGARALSSAGEDELHTLPSWQFGQMSDAAASLRRLARHCLSLGDRHPEGRVLVLAPEGDTHRLWMRTPRLPTLAEDLRAAIEERDESRLRRIFESWLDAMKELRAKPPAPSAPLWWGADTVAFQEGRLVCLSLPMDEGEDRPPAAIAEDVATLLDALPVGSEARLLTENVLRGLQRERGADRVDVGLLERLAASSDPAPDQEGARSR